VSLLQWSSCSVSTRARRFLENLTLQQQQHSAVVAWAG
jgi:hypothetical protein